MLKNHLKKLPYLMLITILILSQSTSAMAATQTISGDPIDLEVEDSGLIIPYFDNWVSGYQYYDYGAKNNVLWLNSGAEGYDADVVWSADCGSCTNFTPVSNTQLDPWTIVTVYDAGSTGIRITQTVSYLNGAKYYNISWSVQNTGSTTYTNLMWQHGGDTYFGGIDSANGSYDPGLDMVYITNSGVTGIMGLLGTPSSPIDHYYEGHYSSVQGALSSGSPLPDTVDPAYVDAGYAVEWDRASLAPGETWEISAIEKWTTSGDVQVLTPAGQSGFAGETFNYNFTIQNLQSSGDTFDLSVNSSEGWTVALPGGPTVTIAAGGSEIVQVQITASAVGVDLTTLTATSQADSGVTNDGSVTTTAAAPPADTDNDGILDSVEGTGDRDGDGVQNDLDYDPTGYFYDEATGEIISGGLVSASGPGAITTYETGATGSYRFSTDGTAGTYTLAVTLPPGYEWSDTCLRDDPPAYDPTGNPDPDVLGAGEDGTTGFLTSNTCRSFYLTLDLAAGDPFLINNNLPLKALPLPATGFVPGRVSEIPAQPAEASYQNLGGLWLELPSLGVSTTIMGVPAVDGQWDVSWLGNQAGYLMGTAFPTWDGNTVITGHVWNADNSPGIFLNLKSLQYGDQIRIHAWGEIYTYQVTQNRRVSPNTPGSVLEHKDGDWVTLFTCEGYGEYWGGYGYRRMVQAVLVDISPAQ